MTAIPPMRIGIIGCGDIARRAYVPACRRFPVLDLAACADGDAGRAAGFARELGVPRAMGVDELLADPGIELVLNLTPPQAHVPLDLRILAAGKHVFSEKPLGASLAEARQAVASAAQRGLRIACAPDTVLGAAVQTARRLVDQGVVGRIVGGSCHMAIPGPEEWHPNPAFLYQRGAGPLLDMGPYYLSTLVTLLGPVRRVCAVAARTSDVRTVASPPRRGETVAVEVPTHVAAILSFADGAAVSLTVSFDAPGGTTLPPIELFGSAGSIQVPDPNHTCGPVRVARAGVHGWTDYAHTHPYREGSRGIGVADLATAIRARRPHRASAELALHVLDAMETILRSADEGRALEVATTCERPAAMRADLPEGELDGIARAASA